MGKPLPASIEVSLPFYGDVLDGFTQQTQIPLTSDMQSRGGSDQQEFLAFQYEVAEEIRTRTGVTDAQVDAEYGNEPQARGPLNWKWVQAILRAIDKNSPGMNQKTLETFTRDVFLYTTRSGVRDAIDRIVTQNLTDNPTVVVGHSLGTVVAYSVLCRDTRTLQVPLYVTVGSPLAVRAIRDRLRPLRRPTAVANWYNAFDTRDVVALYPLDGQNFPVSPAIENNPNVRNKTDNRHGISGYLDDAEVAKRISRALVS
jgi:pimeloyl-ACP methyl ester carboxylesterase